MCICRLIDNFNKEQYSIMFDQNATSPFTTIVTTPAQTTAQKPLRESVKQAVNKYLKQLENNQIETLYDMVLSEVEAPLLEEVMTYTRGNQTKAAIMMGINRGTLRKKLKQYGMS